MDVPGHQVLAHAGFPREHHRRVRLGHSVRRHDAPPHGLALVDGLGAGPKPVLQLGHLSPVVGHLMAEKLHLVVDAGGLEGVTQGILHLALLIAEQLGLSVDGKAVLGLRELPAVLPLRQRLQAGRAVVVLLRHQVIGALVPQVLRLQAHIGQKGIGGEDKVPVRVDEHDGGQTPHLQQDLLIKPCLFLCAQPEKFHAACPLCPVSEPQSGCSSPL